ncbi:LysR family transcriptional regulator [Fodinicola acaciae]|uniref:LysR family transcriptional regulator n=1 Tax=Fodinicola acaciae TaxID=2681555 RepID=UPI0013CFE3AA|nr:LysR family transcriptional regulator [Fodinicola acaciae]
MEMREIEIFLTLADELHFGRTAQRLYLTQARVSQTIRALEERFGGQLFERTSRRVRLTPIGERLREELRPSYEQIQHAIALVTELAADVTGVLRVCVPTYSMAGPSFTAIARTFQDRYPGCRLIVSEEFPGDFDRLRKGAWDIMCHRHPIRDPDLTIGPTLSTEERVLLVRVGHPLDKRGFATTEDLADNAVIQRSGIPSEQYEEFFPTHTPTGRPIPRGPQITVTSEVLQLVARGEIVHPTVASFLVYYRHPEVTAIPLRGHPPIQSALVWVTSRENTAIRAFAQTAAETITASTSKKIEQPSHTRARQASASTNQTSGPSAHVTDRGDQIASGE